MIFICLTPNPQGKNLKIIELGGLLLETGGQRAIRSRLNFNLFGIWASFVSYDNSQV
jgi:hypothetical protein